MKTAAKSKRPVAPHDARTRAISAAMRRAAKDAVTAARAAGTKLYLRRAGKTVALAPDAL